MNSIDDATKRAREMFDAKEETVPEVTEETSTSAEERPSPAENEGNVDNQEPVTPSEVPGAVAEEAIAAAEAATGLAEHKNAELEEVNAKMGAIMEQNEQLRNTIEQMSAQQAEAITEKMLEPPTLDTEKLLYADPAVQAKAIADYQNAYAEYNRTVMRDEILKELEPTMQYAREGMAAKEKAEAIKAIKAAVPELSDIDAKADYLDAIISQNPFLSGADKPMEEKYLMAYMLSKGIDAVNNPPAPPEPPKEPTAQELLEYANKNREFAELLSKQRIDSVANGQQVPPFSASSGAANVAPNIEKKPKNLGESKELFKKMFHM